MIKYLCLTLILSAAFSSLLCNRDSAMLDYLKKKWKAKADLLVKDEKNTFFQRYSLKDEYPVNQKSVNQLCDLLDQEIEWTVKKYNCNSILIDKTIQKTVAEVFKDYKVEILHDQGYEFHDVGIAQHSKTETCYIFLNCSKHKNNCDLLKAILYHELGHVIHKDNFHKNFLNAMAFISSNDSYHHINDALKSYQTALEIRADVNVMVNASLKNTKQYYRFLKMMETDRNKKRLLWIDNMVNELIAVTSQTSSNRPGVETYE